MHSRRRSRVPLGRGPTLISVYMINLHVIPRRCRSHRSPIMGTFEHFQAVASELVKACAAEAELLPDDPRVATLTEAATKLQDNNRRLKTYSV